MLLNQHVLSAVSLFENLWKILWKTFEQTDA